MGKCYKKENFILYKEEISNITLLTNQSWNETLFHWAPQILQMLKWILEMMSALSEKLNHWYQLSSKPSDFYLIEIIWYSVLDLTACLSLHFSITVIKRIYFLNIRKHSHLYKLCWMLVLNQYSELCALKWKFMSLGYLESKPLCYLRNFLLCKILRGGRDSHYSSRKYQIPGFPPFTSTWLMLW